MNAPVCSRLDDLLARRDEDRLSPSEERLLREHLAACHLLRGRGPPARPRPPLRPRRRLRLAGRPDGRARASGSSGTSSRRPAPRGRDGAWGPSTPASACGSPRRSSWRPRSSASGSRGTGRAAVAPGAARPVAARAGAAAGARRGAPGGRGRRRRRGGRLPVPRDDAGRADGRLRRRPERGHLRSMKSLLHAAVLAVLLLGAAASAAAPDADRRAGRRPGLHAEAPEGRGGVPPGPPAPDGPRLGLPAARAEHAHRPRRGAGRRAGRPGGRVVRRPAPGLLVSVALYRATTDPAPRTGADSRGGAVRRRRRAAQEALQLHGLHAARRRRPPGARGRLALVEPRRELPDRLPPRGAEATATVVRLRNLVLARVRRDEKGRETVRDVARTSINLKMREPFVLGVGREEGGSAALFLVLSASPVGRRSRDRRGPLMPEFVCRVGTPDGSVATRTIEAPDEETVRAELARQGARLFSVRRPGTGRASFRAGKPRAAPRRASARRGRVKIHEFLVFNQELVALLKAGLPVVVGLRHPPRAAEEPALQADPRRRQGAARRRDGASPTPSCRTATSSRASTRRR